MNEVSRRSFLAAAGILAASAATLTWANRARAATPIKPGEHDALLVIDVQNCFVPGGSLAVKGGDEIVPLINTIAKAFPNVVLTQDWHTRDHVSFASQHEGKKPFETIKLNYGTQVLWPDHCVQGTEGASLVKGLDIPQAQLIIRKGFHRSVDSYSAFLEADRKTQTGLAGYLRDRKINRVFLCGLATDYCVAWSALDARKFGFQAAVIEDASRGIDLNGSLAAAWKDMEKTGVKRLKSSDIATT
ncbi:MAG TPA: bifunctional nicotinamidase/pyrazinamidase [Burkholderiales bacterium]|nr:bifunctional nicotinamidase/pyrazinamidase [Burkholderiales bacterium]